MIHKTFSTIPESEGNANDITLHLHRLNNSDLRVDFLQLFSSKEKDVYFIWKILK